MSEDLLAIIERKVETVVGKVEELRTSIDELGLQMQAGDAALRTSIDDLSLQMQAGDAALRASIDDLGNQMGVLHEDTIDKIKALAPDLEPIRHEFKAADAQLKEDIDRRLTPLEAEARSRGSKRR